METKLQKLLETGSHEKRKEAALQWKKSGGKVFGILDPFLPPELTAAFHILPWRLEGTFSEDVSLAMMYRVPRSNVYLTHVLEALLEGELDFLDGIVGSARDADYVRFFDVCGKVAPDLLLYMADVPMTRSPASEQRCAEEYKKYTRALEQFTGGMLCLDSLADTMAEYNKTRKMIRQLYELRKNDEPPMSGVEFYGLEKCAGTLFRSDFNRKLEDLMPFLLSRKTAGAPHRILLAGDYLDDLRYVSLVERPERWLSWMMRIGEVTII